MIIPLMETFSRIDEILGLRVKTFSFATEMITPPMETFSRIDETLGLRAKSFSLGNHILDAS